MNRRGYTDLEYKKIKQTIEKGDYSIINEDVIEINEDVIEKVARYKFYYCLWNANQRVGGRKDYENVEYLLGEYSEGFNYIKEHKKELHGNLLIITENYLHKGMDKKLSPQIHRKKVNYSWDDIDILPAEIHSEIDTKTSKETIVRWNIIIKKSTSKTACEPLSIEILKKASEGEVYTSIKKAKTYLLNTYGVEENTINKVIGTGKSIETEKGSFIIFKVENRDYIFDINLNKFKESINKKHPQLDETLKLLYTLVNTPKGKKTWYVLSRVNRSKYRLKKNGYECLNIKWS